MKPKKFIKFLALTISFSLFLLPQLIEVEAQEYSPGGACGFTSPDVQFWGNCSGNAGPNCKTDSAQGTQWGWYGGTDLTARKLQTSPARPIWMQVQCFVQLSFGPGCAHPTYVEVRNTTTNQIIATQNKYDCTSLTFQVPDPGTYRATCYNNTSRSCTASYDTFKVIARPEPCTATAPGSAILNLPADNSSIQYNQYGTDITFNYDVDSTGWGKGCPSNSNTWSLQIQKGCTGNWSNFGAVNSIPSMHFTTPGQAICWRVNKSNGSLSTMSPVFRFTLVEDRSWINPVNSGMEADVCGGGFSGIAGLTGVSNPITFNTEFSTSSIADNKYKEIWLAMVPDNTPYNMNCPAFGGSDITNSVCQNMESADTPSYDVILQKARAANTFVFKIIYDNGVATQNSNEIRAYNGSGWNSTSANGGSVSGLGATLLNLNGDTNAITLGNYISRGKFRIRFDSVPQGKYSYYAATVMTNTINEVRGSYATPGNPFNFKKLNVTKQGVNWGITNWGVDLVPPSAGGQFLTPKFIDGNKFQVDWNFKELNSLQVKSFITSEESASQLQDLSSGQSIIFPVTLPNTVNYNNNTVSFNSINNSNGNVTQANLGLREYIDGDSSIQSNYQFYAFARDAACNQKVITASATVQNPWIITYNGNVSAGKGTLLTLPNSLAQLSAELKSNSSTILSDLQSVYLSTYGAISGTAELPLRKISKLQKYVTNYEDLTIKPPLDSGFNKWYDYIYDLITRNAAAPLTTINSSASISGDTATFVGTGANTKRHVLINGNLTVNSDVTCNTQTIFFVKGNTSTPLDATYPNTTLKITPNLTVIGNNNGCLFITTGDILIDNGSRASASLGVDSSTLSNYDLVEAALITDGSLITLKDLFGANEKADGLAIKGSVVTEDLNLQRDINLNGNQFQPAHLFYFDARYREIFKNDLNYNKYSLREVGYVTTN